MNDYSWPDDPYQQLAERARTTWTATTEGLPIGTHITGQVIGRQPFGVFIRIDNHPDAVGLAEITTMPRHMGLPIVGTHVAARVIWHAAHNHQVKLSLDDDWNDNTPGSASEPGTASEIEGQARSTISSAPSRSGLSSNIPTTCPGQPRSREAPHDTCSTAGHRHQS
ncbi:hypothetical protein [Amycolatopsis sp. NPDC051372]|uniref:hypothetical protein n=1 Tax=Amycolatopsis sp. NPDC051372 TaxID=3155669 RepID=UPI0034297E76